MSAPLHTFRAYFRDIEVGIMDVQAPSHAEARATAWAQFRGIGALETRETQTVLVRVERIDEEAAS
jgi:hypothetical protein